MNEKNRIRRRIEDLVSMHASSDFSITQGKIDRLIEEFEPLKGELIPNEKEEWFDLVCNNGQQTGIKAPRWLCHLVGLKHLAAHIALYFSAQDASILILQVRSWTKSDSPGHLDISVGGHVRSGNTLLQTALLEMKEEIGFDAQDMVEEDLKKTSKYSAYNSSGEWFHNNEWCEVFTGEVKPDSISKLQFVDGEVVGMYLCPKSELTALLEQDTFPIAPALRNFIIHMEGA